MQLEELFPSSLKGEQKVEGKVGYKFSLQMFVELKIS